MVEDFELKLGGEFLFGDDIEGRQANAAFLGPERTGQVALASRVGLPVAIVVACR